MAGPAGEVQVELGVQPRRPTTKSHVCKRRRGLNALHVAHGVKELSPEASTANAGRDEEVQND